MHVSKFAGHVSQDAVFHAPLVRSEIITCCNNTILLVSSLSAKCAYQQWPGELASRARVGAVSQSRRTLYCSCTRCARLRLARRRCRAHACLPARLASLRHVHMWALPRILAERYHDKVRVQTCSHACDLSSTCAHVPAGLLHLHALSSRLHTARVHTRMRRVPAKARVCH